MIGVAVVGVRRRVRSSGPVIRLSRCPETLIGRFRRLAAFTIIAIFVASAPASADATGDPVPPEVQESVDRALAFLARTQRPDGTWPQAGNSRTAVPSLAVMAFLARGHVPGQGPHGELLDRSIDFVLAQQQPNGLLSEPRAGGNVAMYEHGISTVMLSEVYGMTADDHRRERIGRALARSAKLILDAQRPGGQPKPMPYTGGWRYTPQSPDADISVTGWQLMALRGAANCGAAVPRAALDAGVEYVKRSAAPAGGFGYQPGSGPNQARTGTGVLALVLLGQHTSDKPLPEVTAASEWLLNNPPSHPGQEFYFYSVYYNAQALNQLGGKHWDTIYPKLRATLLSAQSPSGSWPGGGGEESAAGEAYRTSMAVLALAVPYRYLPLYQK